MNKVNEFYDTLQKIRDEDFDLVWTEATSNSEYEDKEYEPRHKRQRNDDRSKWQRIFNKILDTAMSQIKFRFESQKDLN
jgi:tRNA G10  N-methylase Trm11